MVVETKQHVQTYFMVVDKKAPTPYCLNLSTALMEAPACMVELWAIDFDKASFDNCTASEYLRFTFTDVAPEDDPLYNPATRSSSRVFTEADLGPTTSIIRRICLG